MKLLILTLAAALCGLLYIDGNNKYPFLIGMLYTVVLELLIFLTVINYRMKNQISGSKLRIVFQQITHAVSHYTDFQNIIPESNSNRELGVDLELSEYEVSVNDEEIDESEEINQKSLVLHQADMYLNQLKNYFGNQKLPLQKFNRKGILSNLQQLQTVAEQYVTYYGNLEKAFDCLCSASLLQKIQKKDIPEDNHTYIASEFIVQIPSWAIIKQQLRTIVGIFIQQRTQLQRASLPQIQSLQRAYLEAYKDIKKQKVQIQKQYNQYYRDYSKYQDQLQLEDKQIEQLTQQYKELKRSKSDPQRLIKMEMNIKLLTQQKQTTDQKMKKCKFDIDLIQKDSESIQLKLQEFKENWDRQMLVIFQAIVRSLIQSHYENYLQYYQSFKSIMLQTQHKNSQIFDMESPYLKHRTSLDDADPIRMMRAEKEEVQQIINKFSNYEVQFQQIEKYDTECLQAIQEITESLRKASMEDLKQQINILFIDEWVLHSISDKEGLMYNQIIYEHALQQQRNIETKFQDQKSRMSRDYKEALTSSKERLTQLNYLYSSILRDTEKLNNLKAKMSYSEFQDQKNKFNQTFTLYKQESGVIVAKLNQYEKRYQQFIDYHNDQIAETKYNVLNVFIDLSREIAKHTFKIIDKFDDNYQKQNEEVKTLIKRQSLQVEIFTPEKDQKVNSTRNSTVVKRNGMMFSEPLDKQLLATMSKEKYVINKLLKVLFIQWTTSLCFRQKFMTELYRSLNKKRPAQLDEIYVTNIDIGGDPPDVLQLIPQKSDFCIFDLEIAFKGFFYMELETYISVFKGRYPLSVKIKVTSLTGMLRLCYSPSQIGKSWFAFIGEPQMNISIEPIISNYNISSKLSILNNIMREFMIYKIKMLTYPNKETIQVPLADYDSEIPENALSKIQEFVAKLKLSQ